MEYPFNQDGRGVAKGSSASIRIYTMTGHDAHLLSKLALRSKSHWGYTVEQMVVFRDELTMTPEDMESKIAFGIANESGIVGFYTIMPGDSGCAELEHLFIDPNYLQRGFGTKLLRHAISQCRALGIAKIQVLSDPNAAGFYKRSGARLVKFVPSSIPGRTLPKFQIDLPDS